MTTSTTAADTPVSRVMLLIDADNVSVDVMEQAVAKLLADHGALHVRRAYCTAESAVANQAAFKRLSIKPMVNLAAGKNSTDIAMAVDALDLVLAERPDIVAIASSDSDFAPLVARLREKGCRVVGIGQQGKTGDETQAAYDDFTVFAHRRSGAPAPAPSPSAGGRASAKRTPARKAAPASGSATSATRGAARPSPAPAPAPNAGAAKDAPRRPSRRRSSAGDAPDAVAAPAPAAPDDALAAVRDAAADASPDAAQGAAPAAGSAAPAAADAGDDDGTAARPSPQPSAPGRASPSRSESASASESTSSRPRQSRPPMPDKVRQILAALPELLRGDMVELRVAAERLRDADLLGPKASSTKLFAPFADRFELLPEKGPNRVRLRM